MHSIPWPMMADDAVYRRTEAGQRELVCPSGGYSADELLLLSLFNGYTGLRIFADLCGDAPALQRMLSRLIADGLLEAEVITELLSIRGVDGVRLGGSSRSAYEWSSMQQ